MKDIIRFMRLENGCKVGDFYMKLITKELKLKEGLILTEDTSSNETIGGIKIYFKPVWKWLLEENKYSKHIKY